MLGRFSLLLLYFQCYSMPSSCVFALNKRKRERENKRDGNGWMDERGRVLVERAEQIIVDDLIFLTTF